MDPRKAAPKEPERASLPARGPRLRKTTGLKGPAVRVTPAQQKEMSEDARVSDLEDQILTVLRRLTDLEQQTQERILDLEQRLESREYQIRELISRQGELEVAIQFSKIAEMDAEMH
jgi:TolA-binding protein